MSTVSTIPMKEHASRRRKLRTALKDQVAVIFAGDATGALDETYRSHPNFEYYTGIVDEPGAILVIDPAGPVERRREMLFLAPRNPEIEAWDGYRLGIGKALRDRVGVDAVFRTTHFARFLRDVAQRARKLACLHAFATHEQPVSPDLALFRQLAERIPGVEITDRTELTARQRAVKSSAEVRMIQQAVDISAVGYDAVLRTLRPGINEFDVQETLEHAYRSHGSRGPAYGTIAGAGINATVLHYQANDRPIEDGDLVCIDSGARCGGYGADITRTFPASGRFTKRQREIYDIVLQAEEAAIRAVKPGVPIAKIDAIARAIITKAGYGDAFIHGIGHHLGLETHDITPQGALRAGNVITIEPGIYLPDEGFGVRIEDDVFVTKDGRRNLSAKIPKTSTDIERMMKR